MPFCTNCGHKNPEDGLFCEECGARLESTAPPAAPADESPPPAYGGSQPAYGAPGEYAPPAAPAAPPAPRKPLPKGAKIGIAAAAAVALVFGITCFALNKLNDPNKTIATFVDAVAAQDVKRFRSVTVSAAPDIELTEASAASFVALYAGNTSALSKFQDDLNADLAALVRGLEPGGSGVVHLTQKDHVLFKSYKVELSPVKAGFISPLANARVSIGGKTLDLPEANREYSTMVLPGRYAVEAIATDTVFGATYTYENKRVNVGTSGVTAPLEFEYATVMLIRDELEPTSLTVNGKECAIPAFDGYGTAFLSPLPPDAQLTATFDYGEVVFTTSFTCDGPDERSFYLEPVLDPNCAPTLLNKVGDFTRDWLQRYENGDVDGIRSLCNGQSRLLSSLASQLNNSLNPNYWRYVYHYTVSRLEGDLELTRTNDYYADNAPCFSTLVFLELSYTQERLAPDNYNQGQDDPAEPGSAPEVHSESLMLRAYIQYVNGAWQVVGYDRDNSARYDQIVSPHSLM